MDRNNFEILFNKCITANTIAIWWHAAQTTNQLTSSCQTRAIQRAYFLTKNIEEFSGEKKKSGELAISRKKDETERATGAGRTCKELEKLNQMMALRFQTEGRHQTSLAFLQVLYALTVS